MKETTNRETLNGWAYYVDPSGAVEATSTNGERRAFPNWSTFWEAAHGQKKGGRGKAFAKILASVVAGIIVIGYLVGHYGGSETSTSSSPPAVEQGSETSTSSSPPAAVEQQKPSSALGQYVQQGPKLVGSSGIGHTNQGVSVALSADGNTAIVGGPGSADDERRRADG